MRILVVCTTDSMIWNFLIPHIKTLEAQGHYVECACAKTGDFFDNLQEKYNLKMNEICFQRSPYKIENIVAYRKLKALIEKKQFDTVFCHEPVGGVLGRLVGHHCNCKVIYMAHGFHFYRGAPLLNWLIYYSIEKYLSKYTDCLITINQEDYEIAQKKFKAKQIELVHGVGIDENKFNFEMTVEEKHELRKSLGLKNDDFVIIYVAELSKRKNQGMLIKAVKNLIDEGKDNIKVLLPGTDSLNGCYQKISKKLGIEENIKFLGYRKDIPKLLKISNLYVSTAKQEGLPVNIMEAMVCGLPIIATNCRGNRDLVDKQNIVQIDDIKQLTTKIKTEIKDKRMYTYSSKIEEFSLKKIYESMIKIYKTHQ